ncbi:MAG: hypothetical protein ACXVBK_02935 [Flavisolibacter sp.]
MIEVWPNFGRGVVVATYYHLYGILIVSYYYPITISLSFIYQDYNVYGNKSYSPICRSGKKF